MCEVVLNLVEFRSDRGEWHAEGIGDAELWEYWSPSGPGDGFVAELEGRPFEDLVADVLAAGLARLGLDR